MNKGKLIKVLVAIILIIIIAIGIVVIIKKTTNKNEETYSNVVMLNIEMLKKKIDNKETFPLIVSKDDCSHCIAFIPVADKVGKEYGIIFYDISLTDLSNEDATYLRNIANISGTPTTVFIINGEEKNIQNRLVSEAKEYRLVEKLKAMGYIDENN